MENGEKNRLAKQPISDEKKMYLVRRKSYFYTDKIDLPSSSTVIGLVHLGLLGLKLPEELRLIGLPFKLCLSSGLGVLCP